MVSWLKHAFAVDPPGPTVPTDDEKRVVERLATEVVRRRLTSPTLLLLECSRNMNFVGSQLLTFFAPFAHIVFPKREYDLISGFLERRGSIEYLCRRLETLDVEWSESQPAPSGR